jgi:hypothetical protein
MDLYNNMLKKFIYLLFTSLLIVIMVACVPFLQISTVFNSTETVFSQQVMQTITARAIRQSSSSNDLATAYANATVVDQTSTAQAIMDNASYPLTATAAVPVLEELQKYGISPFDGKVAWLHPTITLNLTGPNQVDFANNYPEITARDFILASDITWNTNYGLSGCGFMFHSNGNNTKPSQETLLLTRFAYGSMNFAVMVDGNNTNLQVFYPRVNDKSFQWENDTSNRLIIISRANILDIYTNGILIAEINVNDPPPPSLNLPKIPQLPDNPTPQQVSDYQLLLRQYQSTSDEMQNQLALAHRNYYANKTPPLSDGFLGFIASSSAGKAECTFSNSWLFLFNQPPTATPTITPTWNGTPYTPTPTRTETPTVTPYFSPTIPPTNTFVRDIPPTAPPAPSVTQPPAPTATQPPAPTATQPPATSPPATP